MNTQEQIKHLFEKLNTDDQILILEELHRVNNSNNEPPNAASVENCPYCSSVLLSKNGHRGVQQRYKCKVCHKTFTSVSGSCSLDFIDFKNHSISFHPVR